MIKSEVEHLTEDVKEYVNTRYELLELKSLDKLSLIGSEIISVLMIGLFGFLFLAFISAAVGFYLSAYIGDSYSGFFIVAGFYLVVGLIIGLFRKKLISKPIKNIIIKELFDEK